MKKFSTIALLIAFAFPLAGVAQDLPHDPVPDLSHTKCEFLPNAPDKHDVVRGDTLWGISGKFLIHPWCWPQVWGMNKEEIHNPHWIYPGQVVYFDRVAGRLRLGNAVGGAAGAASGTTKLEPQIRTQGLGADAIPAIPANVIEPFLTQPLIIESDELKTVPRIVATDEARVIMGKNDKAYVRGELGAGTSFQVFRPGVPLKDPDTGKVIAYEAAYLGTVKLQNAAQDGDGVHSFTVVSAKEEMGVGDRLKPIPPTPILNYVPHQPDQLVQARIVSIYGGVNNAGQNQIVSINRGSKGGLNIGSVLQLSRTGKMVKDPTDKDKLVRLPDEEYGSLFVFRVFNNISYGLVMQVTMPVEVGDSAKSPE